MKNEAITLRIGDMIEVRDRLDRVLCDLLHTMQSKKSDNASVTLKLDISLCHIEFDSENKYVMPTIEHQITTAMQMKNKTKGVIGGSGYYLVWSESSGEYIMRPIEEYQIDIYDTDTGEVYAPAEKKENEQL